VGSVYVVSAAMFRVEGSRLVQFLCVCRFISLKNHGRKIGTGAPPRPIGAVDRTIRERKKHPIQMVFYIYFSFNVPSLVTSAMFELDLLNR
jgi:hypothetical protein